MYHFPNHDLYHPSPCQQQCQIFTEHSKNPPALAGLHNNQFEPVTSHNVVPIQPEGPTTADTRTSFLARGKKEKIVINKGCVDTSNFSIEERLVAAVWVHERKHNKISMSRIKHDFRQRFGRDPPAKNTLLVWERKLFSTGSVHDAPRPGRPINRHVRMEEVAASVRSAPALSLRARAHALRLPRTTLRTILHKDLPHSASRAKEAGQHASTGKQQIKRNMKNQLSRKIESQTEQSVGAGAANSSYAFQRHAVAGQTL